jgi:uncharacterized OB-fold protein
MSKPNSSSITERSLSVSRPLFLYSECFGCGARYTVQTDFCSRCKSGLWLSDEWVEGDYS